MCKQDWQGSAIFRILNGKETGFFLGNYDNSSTIFTSSFNYKEED
jgi:hypothetical protein